MPDGITTVAQGELVADSLKDYFQSTSGNGCQMYKRWKLHLLHHGS